MGGERKKEKGEQERSILAVVVQCLIPLLSSFTLLLLCYLSASFLVAAFFLPLSSFLLFLPLSSHWREITAAGRSNIGALRQMELSRTKVKIIIQCIYHLLHHSIIIIKQMHNLAEDLSQPRKNLIGN